MVATVFGEYSPAAFVMAGQLVFLLMLVYAGWQLAQGLPPDGE